MTYDGRRTGARRRTAWFWVAAFATSSLAVSVAAPGSAMAAPPGVGIQDATPAQKKDAGAHYDRGAKLFEQKKYDEALAAFEQSYGVVRSPNAHLMLARSLIELGQLPRAYQELVVAEEESKASDRYAATLEKVRSFLDDVKKRVAIVKVAVHGSDAAFTVRVGSESFRPGEERVMAPGHVHVSILDGTVEKVGQDVDLLPGETKTVEVTIPAPPPPRPIEPPPPVRPQPVTKKSESSLGYYVSGGIIAGLGLVGIATGAVFYAKAKSDHDDLEAVCGANGKSCPADKNQQIQDGKDEQAASIIAWVAGGAATSLGLGLIIAGLAQSPHAAREGAAEQNVSVSVGPTWVGVTTRF